MILVLDRDRARAARSAAAIASPDRLVLTGCDAALGRLVASRVTLHAMVTEAQIGGPFAFDGLDAIDDVRRASRECRVIVTGDALPQSVIDEALRRGAEDVLLRPFDLGVIFDTSASKEGTILHIPTIDEFIASEHLTPAFQPIVDLGDSTRREIGFESLARYQQSALPFCDPCFMFEYARLRGMTAELDLACIQRTLAAAGSLARDGKIFINVHPRALADGDRFARTLIQAADDGGVPLDRVVLEVTEQEKLELTPSMAPALDEVRAHGVEFALDDVGVSYSHLDLIDRIRPSYLKISHEFGTNFEQDATRTKIIRNIQSLARDFACEIILEGVETEATSNAAAEIGARYAQGFYYGRPAAAAGIE
ncbi:MAG TPA: EAL domain-containing response regulator [Thermoanaerobaculia bacterium]|nr:EAL domain-containing response regulator [Thermoanaerobaculia bacterium]